MIKNHIFSITALLFTAALFVSCSKSSDNLSSSNPPVVVPDTTKAVAPVYQLVWSDEFNEATIDTSKWGFDLGNLGVNGEEEYYQTQNATISNGNLVITAQKQLVPASHTLRPG
jgi:beta-glucanase (GH16 family)